MIIHIMQLEVESARIIREPPAARFKQLLQAERLSIAAWMGEVSGTLFMDLTFFIMSAKSPYFLKSIARFADGCT